MPKLSVTLITYNEAENIGRALASVAWADERLVVDAGSTDDTVARAAAAGARTIVRPWPGYGAQKNFAATAATHDWIFSLDADERVTDALAADIRRVLVAEPAAAGYRVPRVTWHLGRWIRSTDWYHDRQLRLYDRRRARWTLREVHESVTAEGPVDTLRGELEHFAYRDISDHVATIDRYTTLAASQMVRDGRRARPIDLVAQPLAAFLRNYVLRGGYRDGAAGAIVSGMNAWYVMLKVAKLWERQHAARDDP